MASSSQQHVPPLDDEQETQEAAALLSAMEQYQPVVRADGARPPSPRRPTLCCPHPIVPPYPLSLSLSRTLVIIT